MKGSGGICYGTQTEPVTPPDWAIDQLEALGKSKIMLRVTDDNTIPLLHEIKDRGSKLKVVLGIANADIESLVDTGNAIEWIATYVTHYRSFITHICVGDLSQLPPADFSSLSSAMNNLNAKVPKNIKVSTMVGVSILVNRDNNRPYVAITPPSKCKFSNHWEDFMKNVIIPVLRVYNAPIFATIIPYFELGNKTKDMTVANYLINDGARSYISDAGFSYAYVFDAMLDAIYRALELCGSQKRVPTYVVTGWPTEGSRLEATVKNRDIYLNNFRRHVFAGTPRNPSYIESYIYTLVDEKYVPRVEDEWKHFGIVQYA